MLLTQSSTPIIGWISTLLGYVIDIIFRALDFVGVQNIGLIIIYRICAFDHVSTHNQTAEVYEDQSGHAA